MPDPLPHDKDAALKVVISASISLAIMIADFAWLIRDETKFVWPKLRAAWAARIYLLTRYFGIASQIFNVWFTVRMYLGVSTSPAGCRAWFLFQALVVQFLLAFTEALLMHRIYSLFLRDRLVLMVLISLAVGQMASMGVSAGLTYPSNKHTVTCLLMGANPGSAFFSATTMTTNVIIFFMTFWRYFRLPEEWTRHGIGRVVFRDSALSLSAISVIMLFLTLCSLEVIKASMSSGMTYYWLVCVLWISIGRIIVNLEKIPRPEGEEREGGTWKATLQLTSQIEMGQSALSLDTQCGSSDRNHTPNTLRGSLSTSMTKLSQPSPSTARTSDTTAIWLGDHRHSPQPSNTGLPVEVSIPSTIDEDAPQTEDHPQADADADGRLHIPNPSSHLEPSTSGVSS